MTFIVYTYRRQDTHALCPLFCTLYSTRFEYEQNWTAIGTGCGWKKNPEGACWGDWVHCALSTASPIILHCTFDQKKWTKLRSFLSNILFDCLTVLFASLFCRTISSRLQNIMCWHFYRPTCLNSSSGWPTSISYVFSFFRFDRVHVHSLTSTHLIEPMYSHTQLIPLISSLTWLATAVPLFVVLSLTALKDGIDDVVSCPFSSIPHFLPNLSKCQATASKWPNSEQSRVESTSKREAREWELVQSTGRRYYTYGRW